MNDPDARIVSSSSGASRCGAVALSRLSAH